MILRLNIPCPKCCRLPETANSCIDGLVKTLQKLYFFNHVPFILLLERERTGFFLL